MGKGFEQALDAGFGSVWLVLIDGSDKLDCFGGHLVVYNFLASLFQIISDWLFGQWDF